MYPKSSWKRCWLNHEGGVNLYSCMLSDTGVKQNRMKEEHTPATTYTHTYIHTCKHTSSTRIAMPLHVDVYRHSHIHIYIRTSRHALTFTYPGMSVHTYILTSIHRIVNTYRHTYMHRYNRVFSGICSNNVTAFVVHT